jgi:hypothetical protein
VLDLVQAEWDRFAPKQELDARAEVRCAEGEEGVTILTGGPMHHEAGNTLIDPVGHQPQSGDERVVG